MDQGQHPTKKFEENAYVLDYAQRGRSVTVRGRNGIIITAIGETRLTLLEVLGAPNSLFELGEKIYIGREGRVKVLSVLGILDYKRISSAAQNELQNIIEKIVQINEKTFVEYLNNARPLTPRIHALELIPGIGKTYMKIMINEREKKKFESYQDLEDRVGLKDPIKHISDRIMDEITGQSRMNLFVKR